MKTTPFTDVHIALGAKMHEFAGYNMPIEYEGIIEEHLTVCNGVGVFDVSHMGEIWIKGPKALELVQKITSNDASAIGVGKAQYSCFPNETGGIVDDIIVYHYEDDKYLLVVNAANLDKDWAWCQKHNEGIGAELENASDNMAQLAVQGPKAKEVLQRLTKVNLDAIPYYCFETGEFAGCPDVIISNTGYTGAGGFELYFYPQYGLKISRRASPRASSRSASAHATRCVWRWDSASMATTSTRRRRPSRPAWAGSRSLSTARTSSTAPPWRSRRKRVWSANSAPSSCRIRVCPATATTLSARRVR